MLFFALQVLLFSIMSGESQGCILGGTGRPGCGRSLEEREVISFNFQRFCIFFQIQF